MLTKNYYLDLEIKKIFCIFIILIIFINRRLEEQIKVCRITAWQTIIHRTFYNSIISGEKMSDGLVFWIKLFMKNIIILYVTSFLLLLFFYNKIQMCVSEANRDTFYYNLYILLINFKRLGFYGWSVDILWIRKTEKKFCANQNYKNVIALKFLLRQ